jgi:hypothetical protein
MLAATTIATTLGLKNIASSLSNLSLRIYSVLGIFQRKFAPSSPPMLVWDKKRGFSLLSITWIKIQTVSSVQPS